MGGQPPHLLKNKKSIFHQEDAVKFHAVKKIQKLNLLHAAYLHFPTLVLSSSGSKG